MIPRDPGGAEREAPWDLIVIGGGIYGACIALEAARRGLRPLLLERGDFGGGTSWNSLRILHGGLRHLQRMDIRRVRESVRGRRWFLDHFPDLVEPLPCLLPLYGEGLRRPSLFRIALLVNEVSSGEPRDLPAGARLPSGRILRPAETVECFPAVRRAGLRGAGEWFDARLAPPQRVLTEILRWTAELGGVCLNYVEATGLEQHAGRVAGILARDRLSGAELRFAGTRVVNAAGAGVRGVSAALDRDRPGLFRPSLAFNLLLDRAPGSSHALALPSQERAGSTCFLCPWGDLLAAGTRHLPASWNDNGGAGGKPDPAARAERREASGEAGPVPGEEAIRAFLRELNRLQPELELDRGDVLRVLAGCLPVQNRAGAPRLLRRERVLDHGQSGGPVGLFSICGVKWTTAPVVAARLADRLFGKRSGRPASARRPVRRVPDAAGFRELLRSEPARARSLVRELAAEAVVSAEDLVLRRTDWGLDPRVAEDLIAAVAGILSEARDSVGPSP